LKRPLIALLLAAQLVTAGPLAAQEPGVAPLVQTIDIRVINLDVVVVDRKGNTVSGLKADDFEILENGVTQKITNFYEVTERTIQQRAADATAPAAAPAEAEAPEHLKRKIVIFIDNLSLTPFNRNPVFESMKKFIHESMRPGDEAMIATWNRSLKIRVPFTRDPVQIEQSLQGILSESAFGLQNLAERRGVEDQIREATSFDSAIMAARGWAQSVEHDLRQSVGALNGLMATLAGVEGKKILVMTSEGFPMQPGREMFFLIDELKRDKPNWRRSGSAIVEAMGFNSTPLVQSIARTANANGITLYTLHAGGLIASNEGSADNSKPLPPIVQQQAISNSTDSLIMLADMTGGRATVGTNNFSNAFRNIRNDLESYYSLGYRSGTERVDRQRGVQVRMKNRNLTARARKTFVEKSIHTEMNDRVVANLFYPSKSNDLGITVVTGRPVQVDADRFKMPIEIHIPMEALTFIPQGEIFAGGFGVYIASANQYNDMSDVIRQDQRITVSKEEMGTIKGKHYTYAAELLLEKGRNKISVGIVDEAGNVTGFDRREVLAADLR
jgi:VWFA-related protein